MFRQTYDLCPGQRTGTSCVLVTILQAAIAPDTMEGVIAEVHRMRGGAIVYTTTADANVVSAAVSAVAGRGSGVGGVRLY